MSTPTPIKRDKSLAWLSRDHHDGLLICWKIRQGVKYYVPVERMVKFVTNAFASDLEPHFRQEENLLFIKLPQDDILRLKAEEQHAVLRATVAALNDGNETGTTDILTFANLLDEHIRFEERTLFPYLEKMISKEELETIGSRLEAEHSKKQQFIWHDEFWLAP